MRELKAWNFEVLSWQFKMTISFPFNASQSYFNETCCRSKINARNIRNMSGVRWWSCQNALWSAHLLRLQRFLPSNVSPLSIGFHSGYRQQNSTAGISRLKFFEHLKKKIYNVSFIITRTPHRCYVSNYLIDHSEIHHSKSDLVILVAEIRPFGSPISSFANGQNGQNFYIPFHAQ